MFLNLINLKSISILFIVCVICISLFSWHKITVNSALSEQRIQISEQYNKELIRLHEIKSNTESELIGKINENQKQNKRNLDGVIAKYDSIIAGLRDRPTRSEGTTSSTSNPSNAESPTGATGKELYRDDAEFLARYARDTETLKQYLLTCYRDYDTVKEKLEAYSKDTKD